MTFSHFPDVPKLARVVEGSALFEELYANALSQVGFEALVPSLHCSQDAVPALLPALLPDGSRIESASWEHGTCCRCPSVQTTALQILQPGKNSTVSCPCVRVSRRRSAVPRTHVAGWRVPGLGSRTGFGKAEMRLASACDTFEANDLSAASCAWQGLGSKEHPLVIGLQPTPHLDDLDKRLKVSISSPNHMSI